MQQTTPDLLDLAGSAWGGEGHGAPLDYTPADMTHDLFLADAAPQHHPYVSAIQTITQKHTAEIKSVLPRALTQNHGARNRLRDFLSSYNEQLIIEI